MEGEKAKRKEREMDEPLLRLRYKAMLGTE
jgi:hypothetical protein